MTNLEKESEAPVDIPQTALSVDALRGVVESFVLREGTDYGAREVGFEEKCRQVLKQIERGEARIVFDSVAETVGIHRVE